MSETKAIFFKFLKFGVVGVSGTVVDFGLTYLLKECLRLNKYMASAVGFFVAASSNYYLNRLWTFQSNDPAVAAQYFEFLIISTVGVLISIAIIYFLHDRMKWNFYFAKLSSIAVVMFWNFLANYSFTFNH